MKILRLSSRMVRATALLGLAAFPAAAQTTASAGNTESIVITGTRQAYRGGFAPIETPQAQLTINEEILRNSGSVTLDQALDLSASIARQNNFGGLWNSFAVRGFVGDENLPSNYLVNGFNAGRGFGGSRDLSGIESVEVLKGPRAALFGRGEPGGTVNLVTKRPTFRSSGEFRVSAGSFETYRADADWTGPLNDSIAIRAIGFYEDAGSFRDTVESNKYGFSPSAAVRLGAGTQHEVVRVAEHHLDPGAVGRSELAERVGGQGADGAAGPDRHEHRCADLAPGGPHDSPPRRPVGLGDLDAQPHDVGPPAPRSRSMASPNDRKRYSRSTAVR